MHSHKGTLGEINPFDRGHDAGAVENVTFLSAPIQGPHLQTLACQWTVQNQAIQLGEHVPVPPTLPWVPRQQLYLCSKHDAPVASADAKMTAKTSAWLHAEKVGISGPEGRNLNDSFYTREGKSFSGEWKSIYYLLHVCTSRTRFLRFLYLFPSHVLWGSFETFEEIVCLWY